MRLAEDRKEVEEINLKSRGGSVPIRESGEFYIPRSD